MKKHLRKRPPKFNSTAYYIEEVVRYRAEYEAGNSLKDGYPPVVAELLLAMLISVRAIRLTFCMLAGSFIFLALKLILVI